MLDKIMTPRSIALVGASTREHTIGSDILKRLLDYGYKGELYLVNPKGGEIAGLPVYPTVSELPGPVDLAILVINAKHVLNTLEECHQKGILGLCIISAGFKETGPEGLELERELSRRLKAYGMRCVGPNCLGVVNTHPDIRMDGCFAEALPERGDIGFVSQSGALGGGILNILKDLNLGFAQFISIGNQADINAEDALAYWKDEKDVRQILLYMESIQNPSNFRKIASQLTRQKPVLALKAGRSAAGASAASSHTGALAGADKAADALLRQCGVIRESSLQQLFSSAKVFSQCPIPQGDRIAIVTNSGGPGIMATDAIVEAHMQMAQLSEKTKAILRDFLPAAASVKNPVDMIASAPLEHYRRTVSCVLADPGVDMVIVIYLPFLGLKDIDVARELSKLKADYPDKPIVGVFMTTADFFSKLGEEQLSVPFYMYAEEAVQALKRLNRQRLWVQRPKENFPRFQVDKASVASVLKQMRAENRLQLSTRESLEVLRAYGVRTCHEALAHSEDEAIKVANAIGYPVVMKITSKTTSHKTDIGGVVVNIRSDAQLRQEYQAVMTRLADKGLLEGLEGVLIQEMIQSSREFVSGIATDPQYGPMIMFGLGGIFIEVMKDVAFRLAPLSDLDAKDLIREIRSFPLLGEVRGKAPAQLSQLEETLLRLSQLVGDFPEIEELDINPLMISDSSGEAIAVDSRIAIAKA